MKKTTIIILLSLLSFSVFAQKDIITDIICIDSIINPNQCSDCLSELKFVCGVELQIKGKKNEQFVTPFKLVQNTIIITNNITPTNYECVINPSDRGLEGWVDLYNTLGQPRIFPFDYGITSSPFQHTNNVQEVDYSAVAFDLSYYGGGQAETFADGNELLAWLNANVTGVTFEYVPHYDVFRVVSGSPTSLLENIKIN